MTDSPSRDVPARPKVPEDVEALVLMTSKRRCCLCFFLEGDDSVHEFGQIAHIDRDRRNNNESNLAYLCNNHHAAYDAKAPQSKAFQEVELQTAKTALQGYLHQRFSQRRVTLIVEGDFDTPEGAALFLEKLKCALGLSDRVEIIQVHRSSIHVVLAVSPDDAQRLRAASPSELADLGVVSIEFPASPEGEEDHPTVSSLLSLLHDSSLTSQLSGVQALRELGFRALPATKVLLELEVTGQPAAREAASALLNALGSSAACDFARVLLSPGSTAATLAAAGARLRALGHHVGFLSQMLRDCFECCEVLAKIEILHTVACIAEEPSIVHQIVAAALQDPREGVRRAAASIWKSRLPTTEWISLPMHVSRDDSPSMSALGLRRIVGRRIDDSEPGATHLTYQIACDAPGGLCLQILSAELARLKYGHITAASVRPWRSGELVQVEVASDKPATVVDAAIDSYLDALTLADRIDNSLSSAKTIVATLVKSPMASMLVSRLRRSLEAKGRSLSHVLEGASFLSRDEKREYREHLDIVLAKLAVLDGLRNKTATEDET